MPITLSTALALAGGAGLLPVLDRLLSGGAKRPRWTIAKAAPARPAPPRFTSGNEKGSKGHFFTIGFHPGMESGFRAKSESKPIPKRAGTGNDFVQKAKELVGPIPHRDGFATWEDAWTARARHRNEIQKPLDGLSSSSSFRSLGELGMEDEDGKEHSFPVPGYDDLPAFVEYVHRGGLKHTAAAIERAKKTGGNESFAGAVASLAGPALQALGAIIALTGVGVGLGAAVAAGGKGLDTLTAAKNGDVGGVINNGKSFLGSVGL